MASLRERVLDREDRLELAVLDLGQARGAARLLDRGGGDREDRLPGVFDDALGEQRIAREDRADVVAARHVRRGDHRDHARRRAHRVEVHAHDLGVRAAR